MAFKLRNSNSRVRSAFRRVWLHGRDQYRDCSQSASNCTTRSVGIFAFAGRLRVLRGCTPFKFCYLSNAVTSWTVCFFLVCTFLIAAGSAQETFSEKASQVAVALQDRNPQSILVAISKIDQFVDLYDPVKLDELRKAVERIPVEQRDNALIRVIGLMKSPDPVTREKGATLMQLLGQNAAPKLNLLLNSTDPMDRAAAIIGLARIGWAPAVAVPKLIEKIRFDDDQNVKETALVILSRFGRNAWEARIYLLNSLNQTEKTRNGAIFALGSIYAQNTSAAVPVSEKDLSSISQPLIQILTSADSSVASRRAAAIALGQINSLWDSVIPALITALNDPAVDVRAAAATAIGIPLASTTIEARRKRLDFAAPALRELIRTLSNNEENLGVRKAVAFSIVYVAHEIAVFKDTKYLDELVTAQDVISKDSDSIIQSLATGITNDVNVLRQQRFYEQLFWIRYLFATIIAYGFFILLCLAFLLFRPLWILRLNRRLDITDHFKLPDWLGGMHIPLRHILVIGWFRYHTRVLDAWVNSKLVRVRQRFESLSTVSDRSICISVPVVLDGNIVSNLTGSDLRSVFDQPRSCLLIWGEGGGGKTTIACQIATWSMSSRKDDRICDHPMLPVLLEQEFDSSEPSGSTSFKTAIHGNLIALLGDPEEISDELLNHLLRNRRILVIVDHFSEFSEASRSKVRPSAPNFPAYALVVTSRSEEKLDNVSKSTIRPLRVEGNRLSSFMEAYLFQRLKDENPFNDAEKFDAYSRLASMTGDRELTILLAKLFAEQMIALKRELGLDRLIGGSLPTNIPDLMLGYLNELNSELQVTGLETKTVHQIAKIVAWHCLKDSFKPGLARVTGLEEALEGLGDGKALVKYVETKLRLIRTLEPSRDYIKFTLDPLAEYLAALHVVETLGDDHLRWGQFLDKADACPGAPMSIKEFMGAVRDCCLFRQNHIAMPHLIIQELTQRAGLDPSLTRRVQRKQRLQRLLSLLAVPEAEDRLFAVISIGKMGAEGLPAAEYLRDVIKVDSNSEVRDAAIVSLTQIGSG